MPPLLKQSIRWFGRTCVPAFLRPWARTVYHILRTSHERPIFSRLANSTYNDKAMQQLVDNRRFTKKFSYPRRANLIDSSSLPSIALSAVTYNSSKWLASFEKSILKLDYPKHLLSIVFVDNSSTDDTLQRLNELKRRLIFSGISCDVMTRPNKGFGASNNAGVAFSNASFVLITNVDLEFEPSCLKILADLAVRDDKSVAVWETRQLPYEHPKFYDPVSLTTNWNAHACVLVRKDVFLGLGGYDENIFMYCDDVEISYRFRREGYVLRYCPQSVIYHYSYQSPNELKPLQFTGGLKGSFYIRSIYGTYIDILVGFFLLLVLCFRAPPLQFSKSDVRHHIKLALNLFPSALKKRKKSSQAFAFRGFDYELRREGAWYDTKGFIATHTPLVSIITRTHANRKEILNEAIHSVANQTYANIELVIVEDGSATARETVENWKRTSTDLKIVYIEAPKRGRSHTGNVGLAHATGDWVVFLDDDDLLFSDHIECLVAAQRKEPDSVAVYGTAIEVQTKINSLMPLNYLEKQWCTSPVYQPAYSYEELQIRNLIPIQSILFSRNLYLKYGGFDVELEALEDWNLWLRYAYNNHFSFIEKQTSIYRVPAEKKTSASRQLTLDAAYIIAKSRATESQQRFH